MVDRFCSTCGRARADGDRFCPGCGRAFVGAEMASPAIIANDSQLTRGRLSGRAIFAGAIATIILGAALFGGRSATTSTEAAVAFDPIGSLNLLLNSATPTATNTPTNTPTSTPTDTPTATPMPLPTVDRQANCPPSLAKVAARHETLWAVMQISLAPSWMDCVAGGANNSVTVHWTYKGQERQALYFVSPSGVVTAVDTNAQKLDQAAAYGALAITMVKAFK